MAAYMRKTGILPVCTNNEARDYFAGKGLTYDNVTEGDILTLVMLLNKHIKKAKDNPRFTTAGSGSYRVKTGTDGSGAGGSDTKSNSFINDAIRRAARR